jgi:hypothetical protein
MIHGTLPPPVVAGALRSVGSSAPERVEAG